MRTVRRLTGRLESVGRHCGRPFEGQERPGATGVCRVYYGGGDVCKKIWASVTSKGTGVKESLRPGKHGWVILLLPEYAGRVKRNPRDGNDSCDELDRQRGWTARVMLRTATRRQKQKLQLPRRTPLLKHYGTKPAAALSYLSHD